MIPVILTIVGELPAALALAQKLKEIFSKDGTNVVVQIQELQVGSLKSDSETQVMVADWNAKHPVTPAG